MIETHYVMEDGSVAHPRDVKRDAKGVLRHKDNRAVAYRPDGGTPRTKSVDTDSSSSGDKKPAIETAPPRHPLDHDGDGKPGGSLPFADKPKDVKPEEPRRGYKTRETKPVGDSAGGNEGDPKTS